MYTQVTSKCRIPKGELFCLASVVTDFQFRGLDFQIVALPVKQVILAESSILRLLGYKYFPQHLSDPRLKNVWRN